jgi:hypothetical protein
VIASALDGINTELPPPPIAYVELSILLAKPLLYAAAAAGLATGLILGGRKATGGAVTCAGLSALPASIVLMLTVLYHLKTAGTGMRDPWTVVRALSGVGDVAPGDRPENPALGLMLLGLMAALFAILVATAGAGSALRSLLPRTVRHRPARRPNRVALWAVPLVVAAVAVGYLGWTNWTAATDARIEQVIDAGEIEPILARARPATMSSQASCTAIFQLVARDGGRELITQATDFNLDVHLANFAMLALSSSDPTLQAMGEATAESLRAKQITMAAKSMNIIIKYCIVDTGLAGP